MNQHTKHTKKAQKSQGQDGDDRFEEVYSDPRFMKVPKKVKKIEIDDRFKKGLKSKEFNVITKVDKYGKKVDKQDKTMLNYYQVEQKKRGKNKKEENEEDDDEKDNKGTNKFYDEDGKFKWEAQSSSEEEIDQGESDGKASDEESKSGDQEDASDLGEIEELRKENEDSEEELEIWNEKNIQQEQEGEVKIGKRLALCNMDWDNISAVDILALFNSFCKGNMFILKVEILPSLFGLEQMKKDAIYGPPKDLFDEKAPAKKKKKYQNDDIDEADFIDSEDEMVQSYNDIQLRKYEAQKMKYFYAVIHCNSKKTASKIYDEYNNYEFELSNIKLDLSFIADDLVFPQEAKESATEVPPDYQFTAASYLNKAFNHTKAKLTWDQTDPKRLQKFQKIMSKEDADDEEYREFLASASEDENDDEDLEDKDKIEAYRQKLLGALSGAKGDISDVFKKKDLKDQNSEDDEELDIKFNMGFGEDVGKKLLKEKKEKKDLQNESEWQKYQRKRKEKKREKKANAKLDKQSKKEQGDTTNSAELGLLVSEKQNGVKEVKADITDKRFEAVLKSRDFAIDPTHKEFKKIADSDFVKLKNKRHKA